MTKKSIDLAVKTDPGWVDVILAHFDEFLCDHANCERKASALAMSLVVKYPDREKVIPTLIALAQEELAHFRLVYELMEARGLRITKDTPDPYVAHLMPLLRHGHDERFLDRLLVASIIECRGAERFRMVSEALQISDPALARFYKQLWGSEAKHGNQFVEMSLSYFEPEIVYARLHDLVQREAEIIGSLQWRPALH